jgi:cell division protein FtsW (lipid II flippase)
VHSKSLEYQVQLTELKSILLLVLNVLGALLYVYRASSSWAIPEERGLSSTTGEPFIWFLSIIPIVFIFFILNAIWGLFLRRQQWRNGLFWLLSAICWLIAIVVDFAHH